MPCTEPSALLLPCRTELCRSPSCLDLNLLLPSDHNWRHLFTTFCVCVFFLACFVCLLICPFSGCHWAPQPYIQMPGHSHWSTLLWKQKCSRPGPLGIYSINIHLLFDAFGECLLTAYCMPDTFWDLGHSIKQDFIPFLMEIVWWRQTTK